MTGRERKPQEALGPLAAMSRQLHHHVFKNESLPYSSCTSTIVVRHSCVVFMLSVLGFFHISSLSMSLASPLPLSSYPSRQPHVHDDESTTMPQAQNPPAAVFDEVLSWEKRDELSLLALVPPTEARSGGRWEDDPHGTSIEPTKIAATTLANSSSSPPVPSPLFERDEGSAQTSSSQSSSLNTSFPGSGSGAEAETVDEYYPYPSPDSPIQRAFVAIAQINLAVSFLASTITSVMVYRRRHMFPLYALNTKALLLNEATIPFTVWAWSLSYVSPDAYCWFQLLFWATGLFPTVSFLLFSVVKLYLDHKVNRDKVRNASTWAYWVYSHLRRPIVHIPLLLAIWVESWISIIPRAVRQVPYWGEPVTHEGCNQYTDFDNMADVINYAVYTALTILSALFLLGSVEEAFHLKPKLIWASVVLGLTLQFYYVILYTYDYFKDPVTWAILQTVSSLSCAVAVHLYTWIVPIPTLLESYRYERKHRGQQDDDVSVADVNRVQPFCHNLTNGDRILRRVSSPIQLRDRLFSCEPSLLDSFQAYLVQEFAVENILYLRTSMEFHRAKTKAERVQLSLEMRGEFLEKGALREINIGEDMKVELCALVKRGIATEPECWEKVDLDVCAMLMDSYNRFILRRSQQGQAGASLVSPAARNTKEEQAGDFQSHQQDGGAATETLKNVDSTRKSIRYSGQCQVIPTENVEDL